MDNLKYAFYIYENSYTHNKYILFRGVGTVENNIFTRIEKYDFLTTANGYQKLRNYYDMVKKFGEKPCIIIAEDGSVIFEKEYSNQKEIEEDFSVNVSTLYKRAFKERDIVSKRITL
ncbi:MAG: hypothetical protein ACI37Z_10490 [Candidatus Gastranaerophilaceae bacterium]